MSNAKKMDLRTRQYIVTPTDVDPWDVDRKWQAIVIDSRAHVQGYVFAHHLGFAPTERAARQIVDEYRVARLEAR